MEKLKKNMKKELFVPYEMAKKLKEIGFPNNIGSCLAAWENTDKGTWLHFGAHPIGLLQAPLYQQAIDFLRNDKKLIIEITHDWQDKEDNGTNKIMKSEFSCVAMGFDGTFYADTYIHNEDYYGALTVCLEKTIDLLIEGKL